MEIPEYFDWAGSFQTIWYTNQLLNVEKPVQKITSVCLVGTMTKTYIPMWKKVKFWASNQAYPLIGEENP